MEFKWVKAIKYEAKNCSLRQKTIDIYLYHNTKFMEHMKVEKNLYDPNIKQLDKLMNNVTYEDIESYIRFR